jgi:hypothetical protein
VDASVVSQAVVVWTGYGDTSWPARDEARVVAVLGADLAASVMPSVLELEHDFFESGACHVAAELARMAELAVADFARKHPDVSEEATKALGWCYTYDWK